MDIQLTINTVIGFVDNNSIEIIVSAVVIFVFTFLIRSFKRSLLISEGRARLVLENFDHRTDKLNKWMSFIVVFLILPAIFYVKYMF